MRILNSVDCQTTVQWNFMESIYLVCLRGKRAHSEQGQWTVVREWGVPRLDCQVTVTHLPPICGYTYCCLPQMGLFHTFTFTLSLSHLIRQVTVTHLTQYVATARAAAYPRWGHRHHEH